MHYFSSLLLTHTICILNILKINEGVGLTALWEQLNLVTVRQQVKGVRKCWVGVKEE